LAYLAVLVEDIGELRAWTSERLEVQWDGTAHPDAVDERIFMTKLVDLILEVARERNGGI
jgi:hypothetical protein